MTLASCSGAHVVVNISLTMPTVHMTYIRASWLNTWSLVSLAANCISDPTWNFHSVTGKFLVPFSLSMMSLTILILILFINIILSLLGNYLLCLHWVTSLPHPALHNQAMATASSCGQLKKFGSRWPIMMLPLVGVVVCSACPENSPTLLYRSLLMLLSSDTLAWLLD